MNKKLDRFKQWAGERMGGEAKTIVSDDFKAMEAEMNLRHEGMDRLQKSTTVYVKAMSKRNEGEDKEKILPVGYLGGTMVHHGEDFDSSSEFGKCLTSFGRTNERIARIQEHYASTVGSTWLESLDRSLAQMKDYQAARKKLESRRLAYDTSLAKLQKARREDFRVEEELRSQKVKYEEANEDVYRRMQDIRDAEADSVADMTAFLDAQLDYYDHCRETLMQLKAEWPAGQPSPRAQRRTARSRSNTVHSYQERCEPVLEETSTSYPDHPENRPSPRPSRAASGYQLEPPRDLSSHPPLPRPSYSRTPTFEGPSQLRRDQSPSAPPRIGRIMSDSHTITTGSRTPLRVVSKGHDLPPYQDSTDDNTSYGNPSPDRYWQRERSTSPATSSGSPVRSVSANIAMRNGNGSSSSLMKKGPPPPPPSRSKKPPPPPPPPKRSAIRAGDY